MAILLETCYNFVKTLLQQTCIDSGYNNLVSLLFQHLSKVVNKLPVMPGQGFHNLFA